MFNQARLQRAVQLDALRRLARNKHVSEELAVAAFEDERHRLMQGARVERFVEVLAEKRVRRALRRR